MRDPLLTPETSDPKSSIMAELTRRKLAASFAKLLLARPLVTRGLFVSGTLASGRLLAQNAPTEPPQFGYADVVRRAQELAAAPFDSTPPALPDPLKSFDFDTWRDIRFRPEKAFLNFPGSLFRLQLFHLGHLFLRPVTVNTIRDGIPTPIPYTDDLFDYGQTKLTVALPVDLGFAGFRLHFPLNDPTVFDEVIAFLGASYFRFLGRGQRYGLSARGLAINAGTPTEEFPFFREFWIDTPQPNAEHATIYGLLDGASATGAYHFDVYPGVDTAVEVIATLFPRNTNAKFGIAPLTSMFFIGENDHRYNEDFRRELHDSDGLLVNSETGEWIWRPLRNPPSLAVSTFLDQQVRGFGLLQRDRDFDHYQDLDLAYELRPSYFVEPHGNWGEGRVELIELPTADEANDNIVASFVPKDAPDQGHSYAYRITASLSFERLSPNGRVVGTYQTAAKALGSTDPVAPGSHRFIIDFAGDDLAFYAQDPQLVEVIPSTSQGTILRSWIVYNPHINGFRATIDLQIDPGQSTDLRAFLRAGARTLTETWTYPWRAE
jgi:glucans biosynthesis protein